MITTPFPLSGFVMTTVLSFPSVLSARYSSLVKFTGTLALLYEKNEDKAMSFRRLPILEILVFPRNEHDLSAVKKISKADKYEAKFKVIGGKAKFKPLQSTDFSALVRGRLETFRIISSGE